MLQSNSVFTGSILVIIKVFRCNQGFKLMLVVVRASGRPLPALYYAVAAQCFAVTLSPVTFSTYCLAL